MSENRKNQSNAGLSCLLYWENCMLSGFSSSERLNAMLSKPVGLIYGVDDKPGLPTMVLLGIQHIFALSVAFVFPVVVVDAIGGTPDQARIMISVAMIATGIGTILMSLNRGVVGSGFLCPLLNGPAFLSAAILAGKTGGVSLIFGMTAVGGVFEAIFARVIQKMRAVFSPEVTGTIVIMVGIEVIPIAVKRFVGIDRLNNQPDMTCFWVGLVTLVAMVSFNVWGKGRLRLFSLLLGLIVGYILSIFTGLLGADQLRQIMEAPFLTLPPVGHYGISFDTALLVPFLVATLSSALKAMGDITICQKINDSEWKRPDMKSISRGIMASAIGNIVSGLSGGLGQSVSSSNVGLSIATGATSRIIAFPTGVILILLAFLPQAGHGLRNYAHSGHGRLPDLCHKLHDPGGHPDHHDQDDQFQKNLRYRNFHHIRAGRGFHTRVLEEHSSMDSAPVQFLPLRGHRLRDHPQLVLPDRDRQIHEPGTGPRP